MKPLLAIALLLGACGQSDAEPAPPGDDPAQIHAWLSAGEYRSFHAEREVLPGIAQGGRRVYLSEAAADAIRTGSAADVGAIGVRELYDDDLVTLTGWGFSRKTPAGWQYYETFDVADPLGHSTHGTDVPICASCHDGALRSPWPLP